MLLRVDKVVFRGASSWWGPCLGWVGGTPHTAPGGAQSHQAGGTCPQVSTAEVADAASYMCVAENPAGSAEKLFTLRVQGEPG